MCLLFCGEGVLLIWPRLRGENLQLLLLNSTYLLLGYEEHTPIYSSVFNFKCSKTGEGREKKEGREGESRGGEGNGEVRELKYNFFMRTTVFEMCS